MDSCLIETIAARKKNEFVDPFALDEEGKAEKSVEEAVKEDLPPAKQVRGGKQASVINPADIPAAEEEDDGTFKYRLGKKQYKDCENGDLGCLYKRPDVCP